jgi:hypothetical protein
LRSPGRKILSDTTPLHTPAAAAARVSASAPAWSIASGFSEYTCLPASIAAEIAFSRRCVVSESK